MKMISLLITLGIIGFLVWKQLGGGAGPATVTGSGESTMEESPPRISSNPEDLPQFDAAMDDYLDRQSTQRRQEIDDQAQ